MIESDYALINLACVLVSLGQKGGMIGYPSLCTGSAVSARTAAQQRHALCHIACDGFTPPAIKRPQSPIQRKTLLGCDRNQLARPLIQGCSIAAEGKQPTAQRQTGYQ